MVVRDSRVVCAHGWRVVRSTAAQAANDLAENDLFGMLVVVEASTTSVTVATILVPA